MGINDRLKLIRANEGLSQAKFAKLFDLPQTTYAQYELGGRAVPDELKQQLAKLGYNIHWLVTGEGDMQQMSREILERHNYDLDQITEEEMGIVRKKVEIPILKQRLSAGAGQDWADEDFQEEKIPVLARLLQIYNIKEVFAAEVRGDSMEGVSLYNEDIALFVRGRVDGDGIYAFSVGGEVYVKRLQFNPFTNMVQIISENPKYKPWEVEASQVHLLGKVIGWMHKESR